MGLTIQYQGRLTNTANVSRIRAELKSLANSLNWTFQEWNDDWSKPCNAQLAVVDGKKRITGHFSLKGGTLVIDKHNEAIPLLFDKKGHLRSPVNILNAQTDSAQRPVSVTLGNTVSDNAIWMLGLLKYMKKNYIPNLVVADNADFWTAPDRGRLEQLLPPGNTSARRCTADQIASKLETMFKVMQN